VGNGELEMDGKTWLQNSISIWSDIRKNEAEKELEHPAMFPSALAQRLIKCFSHEDDLILDPFAGTGSTLIAAKNESRYSIGMDISEKYKKTFAKRKDRNTLFQSKGHDPKYYNDDSNNLLEYIEKDSVDLTITSPPYWDILNQKRSADRKEKRKYTEKQNNLGELSKYNDFLESLKNIFSEVYQATKEGGYCCVVVMDLRKKDKFYPLHMDLTKKMEEINFELDDIIIWDRRHEYNNLRPLGYPHVFRVNKVHEFIMIYQK